MERIGFGRAGGILAVAACFMLASHPRLEAGAKSESAPSRGRLLPFPRRDEVVERVKAKAEEEWRLKLARRAARHGGSRA